MATLNDFYPVSGGISSYRDIDYTWTIPAGPDYSDTTGFTVVNNMVELDAALTGGNYKVYLNNGTYDFGNASTYTYVIPHGANFHMRGQSQTGVILTADASLNDRFTIGSVSTEPKSFTRTQQYTNPVVGYTTVIDGVDAQAQGVVIGDYVEFYVPTGANITTLILRRIVDVQATTITLESPIPTPITETAGVTFTARNSDSVMDGVIIENMTIQEDINSPREWFDGFTNYMVINGQINDLTWDNRTTGGDGDFWRSGVSANANFVFNRCTFTTDNPDSSIKGPEVPNESAFNHCLFDRMHVRYGGDGTRFFDCYFNNPPLWEKGGIYDECVFDTTTPASLYLSDNNGSDTKSYRVSKCRYINVERYVQTLCESNLGTAYAVQATTLDNNEISIQGMVNILHYLIYDNVANQLIETGYSIGGLFRVLYDSATGTTRITYLGPSNVDRTLHLYLEYLV